METAPLPPGLAETLRAIVRDELRAETQPLARRLEVLDGLERDAERRARMEAERRRCFAHCR